MLKVTVKENLRPLKELARKLGELDGQQQNIPLPELLTPAFLASCSRFGAAEEMFNASGFHIESADDFKAIPDAEWDEFISKNTSYSSWREMLKEAVGQRVKAQLGLK
jgi:hypothetical protein